MLDGVAKFAAGAVTFGETKAEPRRLISIGDEHKRLLTELTFVKQEREDLNFKLKNLQFKVY